MFRRLVASGRPMPALALRRARCQAAAPVEFLGCSTAVVFKRKIAAPGLIAAGKLVIAKIENVAVIQPRMVAWVVIQLANIRAVRRHGVGLEEFICRILEEGDEACAGRIPPFAEDVKMTCHGDSTGESYGSRLLRACISEPARLLKSHVSPRRTRIHLCAKATPVLQSLSLTVEIKIQCSCGSRYKFDVEPVNGRSPSDAACPNCQASWTEYINATIAQSQGPAVTPRATSVAHSPAVAEPVVAAAVAPPATPAPRIGLRLSSHAPPESLPPAGVPPPAEAPTPQPVSSGRPMPRVVTLDPLLEPQRNMGNFGLGVLGSALGALLGAGLYYLVFIHTGSRIKLLALGVGFLSGFGAKLLSKDRSKELGGITAILAVVSIVGAQYLVAQQWFKAEDAPSPQKSDYEERVVEARKVVEAIPKGTDQEIRIYLAKEQAEEGEKPDPKSIRPEDIKLFRETLLQHYRDLAAGKISKQEYDKQETLTVSPEEQQKTKEDTERTFKWIFLALTLSKFNLVCLVGAAGIAYKLTADA